MFPQNFSLFGVYIYIFFIYRFVVFHFFLWCSCYIFRAVFLVFCVRAFLMAVILASVLRFICSFFFFRCLFRRTLARFADGVTRSMLCCRNVRFFFYFFARKIVSFVFPLFFSACEVFAPRACAFYLS